MYRQPGELVMSVSEEQAENMGLLITEREALEALKPEQLVDLILAHGETVSEYERVMSLASDVLEGAYGTTVEQILKERQKGNGTKTTSS